MYVIRWAGRVSNNEYLASLGDVARWRPREEAKRFETKQEAENYITNPDNGRRYWNTDTVQVVWIHPLNLPG